MKTLISFLMSLGITISLSAQNPSISSNHLLPFESPDSPEFVERIKATASSVRILGLGEASHYMKECYLVKEQIILAMMEQGYDGLILEVDVGQAMIWNDYVCHGIGDLDTIVASSGWFTYRTEAFRQLLYNIRQANVSREVPFQVFGMEMTAIGDILSRYKDYVSRLPVEKEEILNRLSDTGETIAFVPFSGEERSKYWELLATLEAHVKDHEVAYQQTLDSEELEYATHILNVLRQFATYISQDDFSLKTEFRDQFSARNVLWCMDQLGEDSQVLIWAHNGHVAHTSPLFNYDVLGHYLKKWFEEDYVALGFTINHGEFGAFSEEGFKRWTLAPADTTSLTRQLGDMNADYILLDVTGAVRENPGHLFGTEQLLRRDIAEFHREDFDPYMAVTISELYDLMVYIHETTFPSAIEWIRR